MNRASCVFRHNVRRSDNGETATCRLIQQITGASDALCEVDVTACEQCCREFPSSPAKLNRVLPSLLFRTCDQLKANGALGGLERERVDWIQYWAAQNVERPENERAVVHSCDVLVCCDESSENAREAIESVLRQEGVFTTIHLVDDGGCAESLVSSFAQRPAVVTHRNQQRKGVFQTLHELVPSLRSQFVAIQDPHTASHPSRIAQSVELLDERGGEILGAILETPHGNIMPRQATAEWKRFLPWQTLVFRRASLADMGGFCEPCDDVDVEDVDVEDVDVELVRRAASQQRGIVAGAFPAVRSLEGRNANLSQPPLSESHGRGWDSTGVQCDVVLPFRDHLNYVTESMESVLQQQDADVVIHLIDDASDCDTSDALRFWARHSNVRTYRNSKSIGPFASFNNVAPFFETEFAAVQDADDISLPHRLHRSVNLMRLSGTDVFGGATENFGDDFIISPTNEPGGNRQQIPRPNTRRSVYPHVGVHYYLENPTAVFRTSAFKQLGGYANFGELHRNRTGVDTEMFARAYYAACPIGVTSDIVLRYRCHAESATQNAFSGWGTQARAEAFAERNRRIALMQRGWFDPRTFGGLHDFRGITQRICTKS